MVILSVVIVLLGMADYANRVHAGNKVSDKKQLPLMFVVGGPGVGKSRLLVQLGVWIPEALGEVAGGAGRAARDTTTVVLMIKSGNGMALSTTEKGLDGGHLLACRMLYAAFCPPLLLDFQVFMRDYCGHRGQLLFPHALAMICHALGDKDVSVVLLVDEAHELCVQVPTGGHKDTFPYVGVAVWSLLGC